MAKKLTPLLLALCLAFCAVAQKAVADRDAVLARIEASLAPQHGKAIHYTFTQTKHSPLLVHDIVSHGDVTLNGQTYMRWHYSDPHNYAVVVDGDSIFAETESKRHALAGPAGSIMRSMTGTIMSLTAKGALASEKLFAVELTEDATSYHAVLTPKRRDMRRLMQQLSATFDKKDCRLRSAKLTERHDSYTIIEFRDR